LGRRPPDCARIGSPESRKKTRRNCGTCKLLARIKRSFPVGRIRQSNLTHHGASLIYRANEIGMQSTILPSLARAREAYTGVVPEAKKEILAKLRSEQDLKEEGGF